jgi:hypothetical protein
MDVKRGRFFEDEVEEKWPSKFRDWGKVGLIHNQE